MDLCSALKEAGVSVPVVGVVKEVEKEEIKEGEELLGLVDFQDTYFCGPLYQDTERAFYEALGNKPIFGWGTLGQALRNPLKVRRELKEMDARFKDKGIEGNMVGDGLVKGGVLVVDPTDEVVHVFPEDPGNGIPAEAAAEIVAAVRSMQQKCVAVAA